MKKFATILLMLTINAGALLASDIPTENMTRAERYARVEMLENRLEEIRSIRKNDLEKAEKKALRREVKDIKKELKTHASDGIYISAGGLIIIILLILLLA